MSSTFNDPEFLQAMASMGVAHQPGKPRKKRQNASGNPANRDLSQNDRNILKDFDLWAREQPDLMVTATEEVAVLRSLFGVARNMRINPHNPDDIADLLDVVYDIGAEDPDLVLVGLATLNDYIRFRAGREVDEGWDGIQEDVETGLFSLQLEHMITDAVATADQIDPEERRRVFASTRIVAMVPTVLEWIGSGRPTAPSGGLRRADIAEVAAMLGISATGVNKLPPKEPQQESLFQDNPSERTPTIHAMSMEDVPMLASWWHTLWVADVIELASGRVRPGPTAEQWTGGAPPTLEQATNLLGLFIGIVIVTGRMDRYEDDAVELTITHLLHAIIPDSKLPSDTPPTQEVESKIMRKLRQLELADLAELDQAGSIHVEPAMRGAIALGLSVALDVIDTDL